MPETRECQFFRCPFQGTYKGHTSPWVETVKTELVPSHTGLQFRPNSASSVEIVSQAGTPGAKESHSLIRCGRWVVSYRDAIMRYNCRVHWRAKSFALGRTGNMLVVIISFIVVIIQVPMDIWTVRAFLGTNILRPWKWEPRKSRTLYFQHLNSRRYWQKVSYSVLPGGSQSSVQRVTRRARLLHSGKFPLMSGTQTFLQYIWEAMS